MEHKNLDNSLKDTLVGLQHYIDIQIKYNKLLLAKRMGEVSSIFVLMLLLLGVFSFALFFLSFAFVEWYTANYESRFYGHLIVFGFYFFIGLLLLILREPLIFSPIRKLFARVFAGEENGDNAKNVFGSKEAIELQLKNYREILKEEEADLKERFEKFGKAFTLSNIIQSAGRSFYKSFVTTSNIARVAYGLVKRVKGGISKKKSRKRKKEPPQIENSTD